MNRIALSLQRSGVLLVLLLMHLFSVAQVCSKNDLPVNLQNGLVAYYPFCGNANDASGNGNNGVVNGATLTTDRFGRAESAYEFNGTNNYIQTSFAGIGANGSRSFSIWFKTNQLFTLNPNPSNTNEAMALLSYGASGSGNWIQVGLNHNCQGLSFDVFNGVYTRTATTIDNNWHHLVYVFDNLLGSDFANIKMYLDGNLIQTINCSGLGASRIINTILSNPLVIGSHYNRLIRHFKGMLDDVLIYNRALLACEITQLYNSNANSIPQLSSFGLNPLQDTTRICGTSTILDAGAGYASYLWSNGATTQTISTTSGGKYKITATNAAGCAASDSTYLSLVKADIINKDTTICKGASVTLHIDSPTTGLGLSSLSENLRNGLVGYWPFNGNANDESGNGNHGVVNGAILTADRYGKPSSAFTFDGIDDFIQTKVAGPFGNPQVSVSFWMKSSQINYAQIIGWGSNGGTGKSFRIYINGGQRPPGTIAFDTYDNASFYKTSFVDSWDFYTVLYDGMQGSNTTIAKIYRNGNLLTENNFNVNLGPTNITSEFPVVFGKFHGSVQSIYNYKGLLDEVCIWNRVLSESEIKQLYATSPPTITWSTGATTPSITVSPTQTTTYYVTVSDGITSCKDSVTITVNDVSNFNPLSDTTRACGATTTLNAGVGYANYLWSNGATTQTITPTSGGKYKVTVTNASGCTASDSTFLSLVKADIINKDTTICKGSSVTLRIDSLFPGIGSSNLPENLRNGLVGYWPFSGNANDYSGSGNHGIVTNSSLTNDRIGVANSAYYFNGTSDYIHIPNKFFDNGWANYTISLWMNPERVISSGGQACINTVPHNGIGIGYSYSGSAKIYHWKNSNPGVSSWDILANDNFNINPVPLNQWYHVVVVKQGLTYYYYVNGTLDKVVTTTKTPISYFTSMVLGASFVSASELFKGKMDDFGIWSRALSPAEIQQLYGATTSVTWSTGATTPSITVNPTQTTKYYVTVSDGITTCRDSVTITVNDLSGYNPLQDTTGACGTSSTLDAGAGYASYLWSNGATTQTITPTSGGKYKVTVTNTSGCSASDSTYLSLVKADIINKDTTICRGASVTLSIDSLSRGTYAAILPKNLQNGLVAFYPFNGNGNDESGNGNHGVVNGATLIASRFGNPGRAYNFDGSSSIFCATPNFPLNKTNRSVSFWAKPSKVDFKYHLIFGYGKYSITNYFSFGIHQSNNKYYFSTYSLTFYLEPAIENILSHFVIIYENDIYNLYKDGNLIASGSIGTNTLQGPLYIGMVAASESNFVGDIDDFFIYDRALSPAEVNQLYQLRETTITWSTGATTPSITVNPTQTTKYYVTVSDGITSCRDSVTITVNDFSGYNPLQDTTRACGTSSTLDAGAGYASYLWSNGATTQSISPTSGGKYKVTVTNASGCSASDSTYLSLVKAKIINKDTTICKGASIKLSVDSLFPGISSSTLPENLRNGLVAYYPFNGNANDESGNGNHGAVNGATLTNDRFGNANKAYSFNGINNNFIEIPSSNSMNSTNTNFTWSFWINMNTNSTNGANQNPGILSKTKNAITCDGATIFETGGTLGAQTLFCNPSVLNFGSGSPVNTSINSWVHVVYTVAAGGKGLFYINGVPQSSNDVGSIFSISPNTPLRIGRPTDSYWKSYTGLFDDLAVYNRALTPAEVQQLYGATTSITWSTGATTPSITVNPTQTTKYYVTVSDGITSCRDSVTVTVADVDTAITALTPTQVCASGGSVNLQAGNAASYQWLRNGSALSGATARQLSTNLTGDYRVALTNALGCRDTSRAIAVTLFPQPQPAFTINPNSTQCAKSNSFSFTNTSSIASGTMSYRWNFGNGNTSTAINPTQSYAAPGTYTVKLIATSSSGCTDSTTRTITVNPGPTANFSVNNANQCLTGNSFTFSNTSIAGSGSLTHRWDFGDGNSSTGTSPTIAYGNAGTYRVRLITTNTSGCNDTITKTVIVNPHPFGALQSPTSQDICEGSSVKLTASGGNTYRWLLNGNQVSITSDPDYLATQPGTYTVRLVSAEGCESTASGSATLRLVQRPTAEFSYNRYCAGLPIQFTDLSNTSGTIGGVNYLWSFGSGQGNSALQNPMYTYATGGVYAVSLTLTSKNCPSLAASSTRPLSIETAVKGITYPPVNAIVNKPLDLAARNLGSQYQWIPGTYLNNPLVRTPTFTSSLEQLYRIQITTPAGCITVDTQLVRVFVQRDIYVPKGFTPDGDGRNDRLYPITVGIKEMRVFRVYNRWGNLVFDNRNANAQTGWDGTFNGRPAPMETYAWVAEGIDVDGNRITRSGSTVLIR